MLKNICLIGAGNIGSRHLQALAKITQPLLIQVIDPSSDSIEQAKKRYEEVIKSDSPHKIEYFQTMDKVNKLIDIAIIATSSNVRYQVTKQLLEKSKVKYIIFEKILFDKKLQYDEMKSILTKKNIKAWVNCSMRTDPFYSNLKKSFQNQKITYIVYGSQHGLISNAIHYIDHISYLTNCYDFKVDTNFLDKTPIKSKRKGFLELNGTLNIHFKDGGEGSFICYPSGNAPFFIEILSEKYHCIVRALDSKSLISSAGSDWKWQIKTTPLLFQSQMTNLVVSSILKSGLCDLPPFDLSSKMHLNFLEPVLKFLNHNSRKKFDYYPFT